jgi:hypothetical protein
LNLKNLYHADDHSAERYALMMDGSAIKVRDERISRLQMKDPTIQTPNETFELREGNQSQFLSIRSLQVKPNSAYE